MIAMSDERAVLEEEADTASGGKVTPGTRAGAAPSIYGANTTLVRLAT
jgi:hypothetical protein